MVVRLKRAEYAKLTSEEKAERTRLLKKADSQRRTNRLNHLSRDGITSPTKVEHNEPIEKYIADRMLRQEGSVSTRSGFFTVGDGCFRARKHTGGQ